MLSREDVFICGKNGNKRANLLNFEQIAAICRYFGSAKALLQFAAQLICPGNP